MAVQLAVRRHTSGSGDDAALRYEFEQPRLVIGRSESADVRLPALTVSELHATLERTERGYTLRDESSTNGCRVNGSALVPGRGRSLHDGDAIEIGEFELTFQSQGPLAGPTTPERTASLAKRLLAESLGEAHSTPGRLIWEVCGEAKAPRAVPAPPARWLVGRDPEADLQVDDPDVSRRQLELEFDSDGVRARDAGSKNGILVNGRPMRERRLRDGDRLDMGSSWIAYDDPGERALKELVGQPDEQLVRTEKAVAAPSPQDAIGHADTEADGSTPAPRDSAASASRASPASAAHAAGPAGASPHSLGPDAVIYGLALGVLLASGLGLMWLLSS